MKIYNYIDRFYRGVISFAPEKSWSDRFCILRDKVRKIWRDAFPPSKYSTDKYELALK